MMKKTLLVLVLGWFFAIRSPWTPDPAQKATVTQVIGAFKTEAECKAQLDDVREFLEAVQLPAEYRPCFEQREA